MAFHKFEFTGFVNEIKEVKNQGKNYATREVIICDIDERLGEQEQTDKYPQYVTFTLTSKSLNAFDCIPVGSKVKIGFYLTGRKGVSKATNKPYNFNSLNIGTKDIEVLELAEVPNAEGEPEDEAGDFVPQETEDLPF